MKTVMQQREKIFRQMILPPWALKIDVRQNDTDLLISGEKWWFHPLNRDPYGDWVIDILRGFDEDRGLPPALPSEAPHFLFASANTLPKQVEFVKRFGPVLAKFQYGNHDTVNAHQNLNILSFEQQLFSQIFHLTRLINELNRFCWEAFREEKVYGKRFVITEPDNYDLASIAKDIEQRAKDFDSFLTRRKVLTSDARETIKKVRSLVSDIDELMNPCPEDHLEEFDDPCSWRSISSPIRSRDQMSKVSSLDVIDYANELLCDVFNFFPVNLRYAAGMAHDMPEMEPSGIRPALYYMLRLDYLYQRQIKLCARPNCGGYFVPDRKDRIYCSGSCSNSAKQRRHTARSKLAAQRKSS
jgi:hypothetical protein